jgi:hypothetical protein
MTAVPRKVLALARELGAHDECIDAGPDLACKPCMEHITQAYDHFYGDLESKVEVMMAIRNDLIEEWEETR